MPEVGKLGWVQEVERVMYGEVFGLICLAVAVVLFFIGALFGYGWGRDDANKDWERAWRRRHGNDDNASVQAD